VRASGCVIWAGWAAVGRLRPAEPGSTGRQLPDAAQAPVAPLPAPARRRAPARPAHAPEQTSPWNYSSRRSPAAVRPVRVCCSGTETL